MSELNLMWMDGTSVCNLMYKSAEHGGYCGCVWLEGGQLWHAELPMIDKGLMEGANVSRECSDRQEAKDTLERWVKAGLYLKLRELCDDS